MRIKYLALLLCVLAICGTMPLRTPAEIVPQDAREADEANAGDPGRDGSETGDTTEDEKCKPEIKVVFDDTLPRRTEDGRGYFGEARTATVTVTDRTGEFDPSAAGRELMEGIRAEDAKGNIVALDADAMLGDWQRMEGEDSGEETYSVAVTFSADANYTLDLHYTDQAGNVSEAVYDESQKATVQFTVDRGKPDGFLRASAQNGWEKTWTDLSGSFSYSLYSRGEIRITAKGSDVVSPVESVEYLRTDADAALTEAELNTMQGWQEAADFSVEEDGAFAVYLRVTDYCGNTAYFGTDRMLVDSEKPRWEPLAPRVTAELPQPESGIYNRDAVVDVAVQDPGTGRAFSGLAHIWYEVRTEDEVTQSGDLYPADSADAGRQSWSGSVTVDSRKNDSSEVTLRVFAMDRAGNVSEEELGLKFDVTAPVIEVAYDNNRPESGYYYAGSRTATITVRERSFDPDAVTVRVTNTEGKIPHITEWKKVKGTGNGDGAEHTAQITFREDGDYTFSVSCADRAGNTGKKTVYRQGTATPERFTIDQTPPEVTVRFDNNQAENGTYFSGGRRAIVTVRERNFDAASVEFTQTASLDGAAGTVPVPAWIHDGDIHTATLDYEADGDYTFDVTARDLAGNRCGVVDDSSCTAAHAFTVDTGIDAPEVTGIRNGTAYQGEVAFGIHAADRGLAGESLRILRSGKEKTAEDVTGEFARTATSGDSRVWDVSAFIGKKPENDGIYTLSASVWDLAGNRAERTLTFTVNRFGSFYVLDETLRALNGQYVRQVSDDLVITEYNPTPLVDGSLQVEITCDAALLEDADYTVTVADRTAAAPGENGWYRYDYTIRSGNFSKDGIYKVAVSSEDGAGNHPETDNYEASSVSFCVDSTAPEIAWISGMEESKVNAKSREVEFEIFDAMGIKKTDVFVNGRRVSVKDEASEPSVFRGTVRLSERKNQTVRLVAEDFAGNLADSGAKDFLPGFDYRDQANRSMDIPARLYTHRRTVAGALCVVAGGAGILLALLRKRRRR